jgi:hypothetical protein
MINIYQEDIMDSTTMIRRLAGGGQTGTMLSPNEVEALLDLLLDYQVLKADAEKEPGPFEPLHDLLAQLLDIDPEPRKSLAGRILDSVNDLKVDHSYQARQLACAKGA